MAFQFRDVRDEEDDPRSPEQLFLTARTLMESGVFQKALELLEIARRKARKQYKLQLLCYILLALGTVNMELRNYRESLDCLKEIPSVLAESMTKWIEDAPTRGERVRRTAVVNNYLRALQQSQGPPNLPELHRLGIFTGPPPVMPVPRPVPTSSEQRISFTAGEQVALKGIIEEMGDKIVQAIDRHDFSDPLEVYFKVRLVSSLADQARGKIERLWGVTKVGKITKTKDLTIFARVQSAQEFVGFLESVFNVQGVDQGRFIQDIGEMKEGKRVSWLK